MPTIWGKKKEKEDRPQPETVSQKLLEICSNVFNFPLILKKMTEAAQKIFFLKTEGVEKLTKKQWEEQYNEAQKIIEDARECLKASGYIKPDAIDHIASKLVEGSIPSQFKKLFLPREKPAEQTVEEEKEIEKALESKQEQQEETSPLLEELSKEE